ncbi:uncharacterized protein YigE (DUF2233 family) [Cricetibacter osteomyelitidis]|uniref:Uncharacterized protein YigE (DUF2233 family) n=1 Tax=Cricetibacter osteomyelitidis TaxID=1521931 RepID=A0A4R2T410_9PAST|nr:phosphodiester glycosidase family protein [Cricetibacter osteomyelitidis]TCP96026.1 uncharacterized protein YigE (DUF2233 family) [Cricetibacter osteomyelitidis]
MLKNIVHFFVLLFISQNCFGNYRTFTENQVKYGVFQAEADKVSFHWKDPQGKNYRSLTALKNALSETHHIQMLMNGGIYDKNNEPAGLWIEQGKTLKKLNTKRGTGNFHIQPNGVFAITKGKAQILTTQNYQKAKLKPDWAMQSGPMLIINGKPNRQFKPGLQSVYKRNAVCVTKENKLYFFMTLSGEPNMYHLTQALLKQDCYNALYLDGSISNWYITGKFNSFHWQDFVGIIAVGVKK